MSRYQQIPELWALGVSTAQIGKRLGISKSGVAGWAHRHRDLCPTRQQAIAAKVSQIAPEMIPLIQRRWKERVSVSAMARELGVSFGALASWTKKNRDVCPARPFCFRQGIRRKPAKFTPSQAGTPIPAEQHHSGLCQWFYGEPDASKPRWTMVDRCGNAKAEDRPYCEAHCAVAYRQEAA